MEPLPQLIVLPYVPMKWLGVCPWSPSEQGRSGSRVDIRPLNSGVEVILPKQMYNYPPFIPV
jgi:hypothetical protein